MALPTRPMVGLPSSPSFRYKALNPAYQSDPRRILGQSLMTQGSSSAPVRTPLQGLGRLSSALVGAYLQKGAVDRQVAREDERTKEIMGMIPANASPEMRAFAQTNPELFMSAFGQSMFKPKTEVFTQNLPGGTVYGQQSTDPFGNVNMTPTGFSKATVAKTTAAENNAKALGYEPGTPEYINYIREATLPKPDTTAIDVSTGNKFTPEQTEFGKLRAKSVNENIIAPAQKADETIQNIDTALRLLEENPDISGLGEEGILRLKETVGGLVRLFGVDPEKAGINLEKIGKQQVFESIVNKLVLDQTSKLKGALSNKELDFSGRATAQLGTSVEANKVILAFQKRAAIKARNVSDKAQEYFAVNGTFGKGEIDGKTYSSVDAYLREYKNDNEVFGPDLIQSFQTNGEIKVYRDFRGKRITEAEKDALIARATEIIGIN
jgi:hypothetical protein